MPLSTKTPAELVLVDTDFHYLADDFEALVMLATLHKRGQVTLGGVTTVTGNTWASRSARHAKRVLKALNLSNIPTVPGMHAPLLHRQKDFVHEAHMFGALFAGAWNNKARWLQDHHVPEEVTEPREHAVNFMIDFITQADRPVTLLSLAPMTNLAVALRKAPGIAKKIHRLVIMGGAFYTSGNVTPVAEFNWWFDAEAVAIVLGENLPLEIIPLDATDKVPLCPERFNTWEAAYKDTPIFHLFHRKKYPAIFASGEDIAVPVWDAVAAACLIDRNIAVEQESMAVSIDHNFGCNYGRAACNNSPCDGSQQKDGLATVVLKIDEESYWNLYQDLIFSAEIEAFPDD